MKTEELNGRTANAEGGGTTTAYDHRYFEHVAGNPALSAELRQDRHVGALQTK